MQVSNSPDTEPAQLLDDVGAVAQMLGVSRRHVYRLSDADKMPRPVKLGAAVRWSRQAIVAWVAEGCPSKTRGASQ